MRYPLSTGHAVQRSCSFPRGKDRFLRMEGATEQRPELGNISGSTNSRVPGTDTHTHTPASSVSCTGAECQLHRSGCQQDVCSVSRCLRPHMCGCCHPLR